MRPSQLIAALFVSAVGVCAADNLLTDISQIARSWGQVSVYADNDEDYFGVEYVGLPDGCQIVRAPFPVKQDHQLTGNRNLQAHSNVMPNDSKPVETTMEEMTSDLHRNCPTSQPLRWATPAARVLAAH